MIELNVLQALAGGAIIGLASALLLFTHNRVAGISGIAAGILPPWGIDVGWRLHFLTGLIVSSLLYKLTGNSITIQTETPLIVMGAAGLLIGYGSRLGGGCTSGHGVCGIARLSIRSIIATFIFMLTAGVTVYLVRHVF